MKNIKIVVVGDHDSDKTRILISYTTNSCPGEYTPTVFDNYSANTLIDDEVVSYALWDTTGQEDYKKLRPLSYCEADAFILCFSLIDPISLENARKIWAPELNEHCPGIPYILVGTKRNLRENYLINEIEYQSKGFKPVTSRKANTIKKIISAKEYLECDAMDLGSVKIVFDTAFKYALKKDIGKKEENKKILKNLLHIGIYGDDNCGKVDVAYKYILDVFDDHSIIFKEGVDFVKIVEVDNEIIELTIDTNNPIELNKINAFIFMFNRDNEDSLNKCNEIFSGNMISSFLSRNKNFPYIVISNRVEDNNNKIVPVEKYANLKKKFKCPLFEIDSNSYADIETAFYYLCKQIVSQMKNHVKIKKEKRKKDK